MTAFLVIIVVCFAIYIIRKIISKKRRSNNFSSTTDRLGTDSRVDIQTSSRNSYRPLSKTTQSKIVLRNLNDKRLATPNVDITGLQDAYTGEPLNLSLGLYQCQKCKVYYHTDSFEVIESENQGKCVNCSCSKIKVVTSGERITWGKDYVVESVTLSNYKTHAGHVITFEGYVPRVNASKDKRSYAVMFENTSWTKGLKMVVFKGTVRSVGGIEFLKSLKGKTIKVRGLLTFNPVFGYQITVNRREMILGIK